MNMTKIFGVLVIFLLMAPLVAAIPPMPFPIKGVVTINGQTLEDYSVTVENLDNGEILTASNTPSLKTDNGIFFFDLIYDFNIPPQSRIEIRGQLFVGDRLKITACSSAECVRIIEVDDSLGIIDYANMLVFNIVDKSIVNIECYDGSLVNDKSLCPPIPEPEPKSTSEYLFDLAGIILIAFGFGAGFIGLSKYWYKKGVQLVKEGKTANNKDMIAQGEAYKSRGLKMLGTAVKKAAEGIYDKYKKG